MKQRANWLRRSDLHRRSSGYEPDGAGYASASGYGDELAQIADGARIRTAVAEARGAVTNVIQVGMEAVV